MTTIDNPTPSARMFLLSMAVGATIGCQMTESDAQPMHEPAPEPVITPPPPIPQGPPGAVAMRSVVPTAALVTQGKALFGACAACHGEVGGGKIGQGPRLDSATFLAAASDDWLRTTIRDGRAGTTMVAWGSSFEPAQVDALVAYIRSLHPAEPAKLDESPLKADTVLGGKLYQSICYTCHGRSGAGYQETANGTGIGRWAFLQTVSNGYLRHIIRYGKAQTQMRGFDGSKVSVANLQEDEIDDVIGYLRSQAW